MNTVGCIRARLGSMPYYIAKMTAGWLRYGDARMGRYEP